MPDDAPSSSTRARIAIQAAGLIALVCATLLLPATGPAQALVPTRAPSAPLTPFYGQTLSWSPCLKKLECAWLRVPLDYDDPTGATIRLRISRAKATGAGRLGSLVANPGGPGAPGLEFAGYLRDTLPAEVAAAYDIVGFDTRGVGESVPITCLTGPQTTRWLRVDGAPDSISEQRTLMKEAARIPAGCLKFSPRIARHVGSENTVRDIDVLRSALGDETLNWFGFSYGTYLGTLYAEQFPQRVGRMVLDGALDPSLGIMGVSEGQSRGFQRAITRFAKDCISHDTCAWKGSATNVLKGINRLLARIDRQPLPTHRGGDLVQAEALGAIFYAMYSPTIWSTLRFALKQANIGDGLALQTLFDYANDKTGPVTYDSNMASAFPAIACWDTPPAPGAAGLNAAARAWSAKAVVPDMAVAMAWGNAPCSQWFGHSDRVPGPAKSTTTAPIIVIGTTFDPATPYAWAEALSEQLTTSRLLTYVGDGHTAYGQGSSCLDGAVNDYLLTGRLPAAGTICR